MDIKKEREKKRSVCSNALHNVFSLYGSVKLLQPNMSHRPSLRAVPTAVVQDSLPFTAAFKFSSVSPFSPLQTCVYTSAKSIFLRDSVAPHFLQDKFCFGLF